MKNLVLQINPFACQADSCLHHSVSVSNLYRFHSSENYFLKKEKQKLNIPFIQSVT